MIDQSEVCLSALLGDLARCGVPDDRNVVCDLRGFSGITSTKRVDNVAAMMETSRGPGGSITATGRVLLALST
eukprot:EC726814.1.p3 GENE.EC726814.1~~EC726814.1.p3  ORF type:complete len:73 (+),score=7.62 EC726814.1:457-675(+)